MYEVRNELRGETLDGQYATLEEATRVAKFWNGQLEGEEWQGRYEAVKAYWPN